MCARKLNFAFFCKRFIYNLEPIIMGNCLVVMSFVYAKWKIFALFMEE